MMEQNYILLQIIFKILYLLKTIFSVEGVTTVLINSDFISVSKKESEDWAVLKTILSAKIGTALQKKDKIFEKKRKKIVIMLKLQ